MSWRTVLFLALQCMHPTFGSQPTALSSSHEAAIDLCVGRAQQDHAAEPVDDVCSVLLATYNITVERNVPTEPSLEATLASEGPSAAEVWGYSFLCVGVITLTSVLGIALMPFMMKAFYDKLLSGLIGMAVGSLSGSSIFHLIPSAFALEGMAHFSHHEYLNVAVVIWGGIYLFFLIEKALKFVMQCRSGAGSLPVGHGHSHTNGSAQRPSIAMAEVVSHAANAAEDPETALAMISQPVVGSRRQSVIHPPRTTIASVAWMIIFGDGVHKFIDGLSIGAAFSSSILTGVSISLAVFCEEFPHELGDFAVLLNAGMTVKQAVTYNLLSAVMCFIGLVLGILLGELEGANEYTFALAGGMFLYIALVDMLPELNEASDRAANDGGIANALKIFGIQNVGILFGIAVMFVMARFQGDIQLG